MLLITELAPRRPVLRILRLLCNVLSDGVYYNRGPPPYWTRGLEVKVTDQSNSLDDGAQSACDDECYQEIAENL